MTVREVCDPRLNEPGWSCSECRIPYKDGKPACGCLSFWCLRAAVILGGLSLLILAVAVKAVWVLI